MRALYALEKIMPFPVDEKFISKAEFELEIKFPLCFCERMKLSNGGSVEVGKDVFNLMPFYDTSDKKRIKRTCNSIVHETKSARENYGFPKDLVIIGENGGGDFLVFKINETQEVSNTVYWWDHETEELVFAAKSFEVLDARV
jgi:hypothetical protein|tara:strand:- start:1948 stop:2376 length:429 start_codon:yes stop_codon:yes gene_type:complete